MAGEMQNKAPILALCHTPKDAIGVGSCDTFGLPLTMSMLSAVETLDVQADGGADYVADLTRALPPNVRKATHGRFAVVSTLCCVYTAFVHEEPMRGLVQRAWLNVSHMLRPGGFFLFTTALTGVESLHEFFFARPPPPEFYRDQRAFKRTEALVLAALAAHIGKHEKFGLESVDLAGDSDFARWYRDFARRHATRVFIYEDGRRFTHSAADKLRDLQRKGILVFRRR